MRAIGMAWIMVLGLLGGCLDGTPLQIANGPGATKPEDIPQLGGGATGPLQDRTISLRPGSRSGALPGATGSVTPTRTTTGTGSVDPTGTTTGTGDTVVTTAAGSFTKKPYKRAPGEMVVYIPSEAGDYARTLQRLVADGIPLDKAIAGSIVDAMQVNPKFGKIVAEISQLNPTLEKDIATAEQEAGSDKARLTIIELDRQSK